MEKKILHLGIGNLADSPVDKYTRQLLQQENTQWILSDKTATGLGYAAGLTDIIADSTLRILAVSFGDMDESDKESLARIIAAGLRKRMDSQAGRITLLASDNIPENGNALAKEIYADIEDSELALTEWLAGNVTFPNSQTTDGAWLVEDKFAAERPDWEKVGVKFTDDIATYDELQKLQSQD